MTQQELVATALLDLLEDRQYRLTRTPSKPSVAATKRPDPIGAVARELSQAITQEMDRRPPAERAALRTEIEQALLGIFRA